MASLWENYISLDDMRINESKDVLMSDNGEGVERMLDEIDGVGNLYERRANAAREFIRRNAPRLLPVLNLIIKNGSNRKESIWSMLKKPRRGHRLRMPTTKRGKRFLGSSDAAMPNGGFDTAAKK